MNIHLNKSGIFIQCIENIEQWRLRTERCSFILNTCVHFCFSHEMLWFCFPSFINDIFMCINNKYITISAVFIENSFIKICAHKYNWFQNRSRRSRSLPNYSWNPCFISTPDISTNHKFLILYECNRHNCFTRDPLQPHVIYLA